MGNPALDRFGGGNNSMVQTFGKYMQMMQGKDPRQIIQQMLQSGQINQQQLNQAQQMAQQMRGMLEPFFHR